MVLYRRGSGAQGRNRTTDTVIFSHVLYQLSYLGDLGIRVAGATRPTPRHPSAGAERL